MKIKVNKYSLSPRWFVGGVKGSYGTEKLEFEFSDDWEGLTKRVTFYPYGGQEVSWIQNLTSFTIPYEVMSRGGTCTYAISGFKDEVKMLTVTGEIQILETVAPPDNGPVVPTPDIVTQIMQLANEANEASQSALATVEEANEGIDELTELCTETLVRVEGVSSDIESKYQHISEAKEYIEGLTEANSTISDNVNEAKNAVLEAHTNVMHTMTDFEEIRTEIFSARNDVFEAEDDVHEARAEVEEHENRMKKELSNAVFGKAVGKAKRVDAVSPFEQNVELSIGCAEGEEAVENPTFKLMGKNILRYPYKEKSQTINGLTFTSNSDGSITLNGTVDENVTSFGGFFIQNSESVSHMTLRKNAVYRARLLDSEGNNISTGFDLRICDESSYGRLFSQTSNKYIPSKDKPIHRVLLYITSASCGKTFENYTFFPVLELTNDESESVVFEPYFEQSVTIPLTIEGNAECKDEVNASEGRVTYIKRCSDGATLAEPIITDCTDTEWGQGLLQILKLNKDFSFDCGAECKIRYNQDINKVITKLTEAIVALGGSI